MVKIFPSKLLRMLYSVFSAYGKALSTTNHITVVCSSVKIFNSTLLIYDSKIWGFMNQMSYFGKKI